MTLFPLNGKYNANMKSKLNLMFITYVFQINVLAVTSCKIRIQVDNTYSIYYILNGFFFYVYILLLEINITLRENTYGSANFTEGFRNTIILLSSENKLYIQNVFR